MGFILTILAADRARGDRDDSPFGPDATSQPKLRGQGDQGVSSFFKVMLKRLIFHTLIVTTRGLSPLSPTVC